MAIATYIKNLFWRRRRTLASGPGTIGGKNQSGNDALETLETWSGRATLTILLGIVLEIGVVIAFPHKDVSLTERLFMVGANALVLLGLAVEYIVIRRTIVATGELQRESDERVAALEKETAEARLETEQLRAAVARRHITVGQREIIASALRKKSFSTALSLETVRTDPEAVDFTEEVDATLMAAGVKGRGYSTGWSRAAGLLLLLARPETEASRRDAESLIEAFAAAGWQIVPEQYPTEWAPVIDRIAIVVGTKPAPF